MFAGKKKVLFATVLSAGLLGLAGCYTQVKLFTRVSEEPPLVQEQKEEVIPEYHYYYYHHYTSRWNEPYWYRSRFYWPSYLHWRSYRDYWDWCETRYWHEPCWDDMYWVRVYHHWYGSSYYRWGYYDYYPGYYYYDPWWGERYYRQERPQPSRRREYDTATSRAFSEAEKTVAAEEPSLWIRSRPESRSEKRVVEQVTQRSTEVKKAGERKRSQSSTEEEQKKKEEETSKRKRKPDFQKARER